MASVGRPLRPLDPRSGPLARFALELRTLRAAAGEPAFWKMARRCDVSKSALAEAVGGQRLPSWRVVEQFVLVCGGDLDWWRDRWHQALSETARAEAVPPDDEDSGEDAAAGVDIVLAGPTNVLDNSGTSRDLIRADGSGDAQLPAIPDTGERGPTVAQPPRSWRWTGSRASRRRRTGRSDRGLLGRTPRSAIVLAAIAVVLAAASLASTWTRSTGDQATGPASSPMSRPPQWQYPDDTTTMAAPSSTAEPASQAPAPVETTVPRATSPSPVHQQTSSPAPPAASPVTAALLGAPDFDGYCRATAQGPVQLIRNDGYGWRCSADNGTGDDANAVCAWTFRTSQITNRIADFSNPFSWQCWRASRKLGSLDFAAYCRILGSPGAFSVDGRNAYGWYCTNSSAPLDAQDACQRLYGSTPPISRFQNFYDKNSWECWQ